ncbi:hypothetical protein [Leisingera caerulea]|uniref:Uncharacterized protein n=1 Tax=Leisingera caerulea TaxID=506591 RepID=A0A9Q9HIM9_LEICA|nr:hypothetical protein [Leisingera caerulea]UWQ52740.1 hypothetical protein K3721_12000 [Leisingera caerulea]
MADDEPGADGAKRPSITPEEVLKGLVAPQGGASEASKAEKQYLKRFRALSLESQTGYAHLQGIRDHYKHKGRWSNFLIFAIGGMLVFQSILLWRVGMGKLDFKDYDWLLPALLVQNLGQVIGLAVFAVKYLFSDISNQNQKSK